MTLHTPARGSNHAETKSNSSTTKKSRERGRTQQFLMCRFRNRTEMVLTTAITPCQVDRNSVQRHPKDSSNFIGVCLPESFQFRTQRKQQSSFTSSHTIGDPHSKNQQYITRVLIQHDGRCTVPLRGELYTSAMLFQALRFP